jgi:hypothetical protein
MRYALKGLLVCICLIIISPIMLIVLGIGILQKIGGAEISLLDKFVDKFDKYIG